MGEGKKAGREGAGAVGGVGRSGGGWAQRGGGRMGKVSGSRAPSSPPEDRCREAGGHYHGAQTPRSDFPG